MFLRTPWSFWASFLFLDKAQKHLLNQFQQGHHFPKATNKLNSEPWYAGHGKSRFQESQNDLTREGELPPPADTGKQQLYTTCLLSSQWLILEPFQELIYPNLRPSRQEQTRVTHQDQLSLTASPSASGAIASFTLCRQPRKVNWVVTVKRSLPALRFFFGGFYIWPTLR